MMNEFFANVLNNVNVAIEVLFGNGIELSSPMMKIFLLSYCIAVYLYVEFDYFDKKKSETEDRCEKEWQELRYTLEVRRKIQDEIYTWIAKRSWEMEKHISWQWVNGKYDEIELSADGESGILKLNLIEFDGSDCETYFHIESASFTDEDGKTYTGKGPSLCEIPAEQYESYFKALILKNMPFFAEAVEKLEGINSVSFTFQQAVGRKAESQVEFNSFLRALNEELTKIGVFATGNYATQVIEVAKAK